MKRDLHTILHTNVCSQWVQKQPKFQKFLKNAKNLNSKPVLESVLVTESKTVLGFLCLAREVQFFGYPKMPKIKLLGTQKIIIFLKISTVSLHPTGREVWWGLGCTAWWWGYCRAGGGWWGVWWSGVWWKVGAPCGQSLHQCGCCRVTCQVAPSCVVTTDTTVWCWCVVRAIVVVRSTAHVAHPGTMTPWQPQCKAIWQDCGKSLMLPTWSSPLDRAGGWCG